MSDSKATTLFIPTIVGAMAIFPAASISAAPGESPVTPMPAPAPKTELLATDTAKTTVLGSTFIAPAGWTVAVRGAATILTAPEGDSWLALVDTAAKDADAAVASAWAAYKPN